VIVEIEHHIVDEKNQFHTRYRKEKYEQVANEIREFIGLHLNAEGISHNVVVNPGPSDPWKPYLTLQNCYIRGSNNTRKLHYPRLGAFEVTVHCAKDFISGTRVPQNLDLWSKLRTRRWPKPSRLASDLKLLLVTGRDGGNPGPILTRIKDKIDEAAFSYHSPSHSSTAMPPSSPLTISVARASAGSIAVSLRSQSRPSSSCASSRTGTSASLPRPSSAHTPGRSTIKAQAAAPRRLPRLPRPPSSTSISHMAETSSAQEAEAPCPVVVDSHKEAEAPCPMVVESQKDDPEGEILVTAQANIPPALADAGAQSPGVPIADLGAAAEVTLRPEMVTSKALEENLLPEKSLKPAPRCLRPESATTLASGTGVSSAGGTYDHEFEDQDAADSGLITSHGFIQPALCGGTMNPWFGGLKPDVEVSWKPDKVEESRSASMDAAGMYASEVFSSTLKDTTQESTRLGSTSLADDLNQVSGWPGQASGTFSISASSASGCSSLRQATYAGISAVEEDTCGKECENIDTGCETNVAPPKPATDPPSLPEALLPTPEPANDPRMLVDSYEDGFEQSSSGVLNNLNPSMLPRSTESMAPVATGTTPDTEEVETQGAVEFGRAHSEYSDFEESAQHEH